MARDEFEFGEDFEGIQEAPIPDMFDESDSPPVDIPQDNDFGDGGSPVEEQPIPPAGTAESGIPDPGRPVPRPAPRQRDYNAQSQTGARQARTQQMHQGYSQPGQSVAGGVDEPQAPAQGPAGEQGQQPQQKRQRPPLPGYRQQQSAQPANRVTKDASGNLTYNGQIIQYGPLGQPYVMGSNGQPILFAPDGSLAQLGQDGWLYMAVQGGEPIRLAPNCKPVQYTPDGQPYMVLQDGSQCMLDQNGQMIQSTGKKGKKQKAPKQPKAPKPPKGDKPPKPPKPPKEGGKKGLGKIPLIIGVVVVIVLIALLAMKFLGGGNKLEPRVQSYETSGRFALDTLVSSLNSYNPEGMDSVVGTEEGDSYLAQEWAYVNNVKIRQEFLQTVGALVKFEYPKEQQLSTTGVGMTDEAGNPIMIESYMNGGEAFTVTIPDYDKLCKTMDEKADYILQMLESSKYSERDYTWPDELTNLMLQFVLDDGPIPTKQVECTLPIRLDVSGKPYIETDANLDDLLFGSEEFHNMCAKFSQICVGWTGHIEEVYLTYEREHNEEYDRWLELFLVYFEADGGVYDPDGDPKFTNVQKAFKRHTSKWEPWYLRDDNNVIQRHPDGTYIVNYFSVKDENGNDWIQPAEQIEKEVENTRLLDDPWVEETGIWYNWLGMHFLETYNGVGEVVTRVGDGSRDHPAGIGTTIITKVLGTDGMYHDVKVALVGYWTGQNAIDYAEKFSSRNRGFTVASVVQLICFEVSVENLEDQPIEFLSSEMTLTDRNSNISSRTGTMYDFTGTVYLEARGNKQGLHKTILNDWATSTELAQKYVCWGKSFGRMFNMVYFDCLAGTGNIPSYSAYKQFTGQSSIDEEITH